MHGRFVLCRVAGGFRRLLSNLQQGAYGRERLQGSRSAVMAWVLRNAADQAGFPMSRNTALLWCGFSGVVHVSCICTGSVGYPHLVQAYQCVLRSPATTTGAWQQRESSATVGLQIGNQNRNPIDAHDNRANDYTSN